MRLIHPLQTVANTLIPSNCLC